MVVNPHNEAEVQERKEHELEGIEVQSNSIVRTDEAAVATERIGGEGVPGQLGEDQPTHSPASALPHTTEPTAPREEAGTATFPVVKKSSFTTDRTESRSTNATWMQEVNKKDRKPLWIVGLINGLALTIHNFPEGMVTFAATLSNPTFGVLMAIGVGLHNIPEGIAIAVPIYYSTESKWKALGWASLSAAAEPAGALVAWAILSSTRMNDIALAILFGLTAGIMIHISIVKLLPTAFNYDKRGVASVWSIMAGMTIMGTAGVILEASGGHSHGHQGHDHRLV
eukprot:Platyproteum_vivax@DN6545_c0_g1_i2.p1